MWSKNRDWMSKSAVVLDEGGACATIIGGALWDPNF